MKNQKKKHLDPGHPDFVNPFLTEDREALWEKLLKNAVPISPEEVYRRAEVLRKAHEKKHGGN
jgi:hypothetical protein